MIIKLRSLAYGERYATAVQGYHDVWINMDQASHAILKPGMVGHVEIFNECIPIEEWEDAVREYHAMKYNFHEVKEDDSDGWLGYQFTSIIEDDGRTLECFPKGLAGQEVRVTVLGNPWEAK